MEKNIYPNKISFLKTNLILLSLGEDSLKSSHIIRKNNKVFLNIEGAKDNFNGQKSNYNRKVEFSLPFNGITKEKVTNQKNGTTFVVTGFYKNSTENLKNFLNKAHEVHAQFDLLELKSRGLEKYIDQFLLEKSYKTQLKIHSDLAVVPGFMKQIDQDLFLKVPKKRITCSLQYHEDVTVLEVKSLSEK